MGWFSRSKRSTTQNIQNTLHDERINAANYGNLDSDGGEILQFQGLRDSSVNVQLTDRGAVDKAFESIDSNNEKAFNAVQDTVEESLSLVRDTNDSSFEFATRALEGVEGGFNDSLSTIQSATNNVIRSLAETTRSEQNQLFGTAAKYGTYALVVIGITLGFSMWAAARR